MMANTVITIGEDVTVILSHRSHLYAPLFPNQPKTLTFTGKVIGHSEDDGPNTVRISGDRDMPVRVLHYSKIIKWNGKNFHYTPTVPRQKVKKAEREIPKYVTVKGSKGDEYTLTVWADGRISCSCPGYGFRKSCRHTKEYKE